MPVVNLNEVVRTSNLV